MNLIKNECSERINKIKKKIDESPERIRYVREELESMIAYIKKLKKQNPDYSIGRLNRLLYYKMKEAICQMNAPTRSDIYLYKTSEYLLKNLDLILDEIKKVDLKRCIQDDKKMYTYTSSIEKNTKIITEEILTIMLKKSSKEFKQKFINNTLNDEEKKKLKEKVQQALVIFHDLYAKEMKKQYSFKLAKIVSMLDERGHLKKYNDRNSKRLEELNLPMLKYEYEVKENKFGLTDLKNPDFIQRFSLEEIIAMCSFYGNRLAKEVVNYNETLYIVNKLGILEEIFENEEYELKAGDEELREILAQLGFLSENALEIAQEGANKSNSNRNSERINLEDNKARNNAINTYEKLYNELYQNFFLNKYDNDFKTDLDIATILEIDRYNLYLSKDFNMESLMVFLTDKGKNKSMNWGYIPENNNGKNSIQNKEKFVLIGIDMKGYNMPLKLHFEREKLETFLTNYIKDTKLPLYEENEDMEISWSGYMTTQVYMPLSKEQRKQLKQTKLPKSDYRYRFLEHIKWMMLPNRYPDYLCDHQGNKKKKRYIDIKSGKTLSVDEAQEL